MAVATAIENAPIIAPILGLAVLLAAQYYLGSIPDLWRFRRAVLPTIAAIGDDTKAHPFEAVDDAVESIDISETIPEKTSLPLHRIEYAGIVDAPPSKIREELRRSENIYPCNLASIQYDLIDGEKVWEVGSYAERPGGWLGRWQTHVRLTETDDGRTALWAHREYSPWRAPVKHYRSVSWDATEGVKRVQSWFEDDDRFEPAQ